MSYYAFDDNGYLGDAASISGWNSFAAWATAQGGKLEQLVANGHSNDPAALTKQLQGATAQDADAESVRANLATLAAKAGEIFIISEGDSGP